MDKPIYVVMFGEDYACAAGMPGESVPAFGTRDEAEDFARKWATASGRPLHEAQVIEYAVTGAAPIGGKGMRLA